MTGWNFSIASQSVKDSNLFILKGCYITGYVGGVRDMWSAQVFIPPDSRPISNFQRFSYVGYYPSSFIWDPKICTFCLLHSQRFCLNFGGGVKSKIFFYDTLIICSIIVCWIVVLTIFHYYAFIFMHSFNIVLIICFLSEIFDIREQTW